MSSSGGAGCDSRIGQISSPFQLDSCLSTHISLQFITRPIADQTTWTELLCVALVGVGVVNDSTTAAGPCAAH